jgi:uncharacterized protein (DUF4415 family)
MRKRSTTSSSTDAPIQRRDIAAGRLVPRRRGPDGAVIAPKLRVNIMLDAEIVAHFRERAGTRGYQTLINDALRRALHAESLEAVVRRTIREELRRGG